MARALLRHPSRVGKHQRGFTFLLEDADINAQRADAPPHLASQIRHSHTDLLDPAYEELFHAGIRTTATGRPSIEGAVRMEYGVPMASDRIRLTSLCSAGG